MHDDEYRALVEEITDALLRGDELEDVAVHRDASTGEVWVRVVACGEVFEDRLDSPEWDAAGVREFDALKSRLASHVSDWIAESRFGWGEQRL
jgi:hypothetical protein